MKRFDDMVCPFISGPVALSVETSDIRLVNCVGSKCAAMEVTATTITPLDGTHEAVVKSPSAGRCLLIQGAPLMSLEGG